MSEDNDRQHDPPLEGSAAQGRELVYWLANACRALREDFGVTTATVAHYAGEEDTTTIERFEKVKTFPRKLDPIIAAYARAVGWGDSREIYAEMYDLWVEEGWPHEEAGRDGATRADRRAVEAAVDARKRQVARERRQARRESASAPKSSRTRRKAAG